MTVNVNRRVVVGAVLAARSGPQGRACGHPWAAQGAGTT
jgi:hypothetical protein